MTPDDVSPAEILRTLAEVLGDENADSDDLIYAFGDVEARRAEIAALLLSLLEQTPK